MNHEPDVMECLSHAGRGRLRHNNRPGDPQSAPRCGAQNQTPCDYWGYYGGLLLKDLTPGVEVTLRGAAPGYTPREMRFLPFPTPGSYQAVFIELSEAR